MCLSDEMQIGHDEGILVFNDHSICPLCTIVPARIAANLEAPVEAEVSGQCHVSRWE